MGNEGEKLGDLADAFMAENPGVTVNVTPVDWGQAVDKLQTAIARRPDARRQPDRHRHGWASSPQTGALEPVPANFDRATFFEGAWNTASSTAPSTACRGTSRRGCSTTAPTSPRRPASPTPPATWDDLTAIAKAMQDKGGAKYGIALGTKNWQEYLPFVWSERRRRHGRRRASSRSTARRSSRR